VLLAEPGESQDRGAVMVALNQMFAPVQAQEKRFMFTAGTEGKIAQEVDRIFRVHPFIPVPDQGLIHFFDAAEGAITVTQDIDMIEMGIGCQPDHVLTSVADFCASCAKDAEDMICNAWRVIKIVRFLVGEGGEGYQKPHYFNKV